ncbi:MAG: hypothetical protein Q8L55_06250, partial [Phycisphaerales bacterium]|nr:hypothetical protein [Phycisphaerales bacterium]
MRPLLSGVLGGAIASVVVAMCSAQTTTLISRNSSGAIGDGAGLPTTGLATVSADGWFVAFVTFIPDLVPGDTNGFPDVFLRNRHDNTTTRVSISSLGAQGDDISGLDPVEFDGSMGLSLAGRYIAFPSAATNLVAGDTNNATDIFVRDTVGGTTSRVSISISGTEGNGRCLYCAMSPSLDGRFVVFDSDATNLVTGDTNGRRDIFIRDRQLNTTERVSVSTAGVQADQDCVKPSVSADGRFVVFTSGASNLAPPAGNPGRSVFLRDRTLGQTFLIGVCYDPSSNGTSDEAERAAVSDDGRYVAFGSNDPALVGFGANANRRTFVKDRQTGLTSEASIFPGGPSGRFSDHSTAMSPDGRYVGFTSLENGGCGRWQAYIRDRTLATTTLVSVSPTGQPSDGGIGAVCLVSANGGIAVFDGNAANLVTADTNGRGDVFVRDMAAGTTALASVSTSGSQGTAYTGVASVLAGMTPDAAHAVMISTSENLVGCVQAEDAQVYARDIGSGVTELISVAYWGGSANNGASDAAAISDNGRYVAFTSESSQVIDGDTNNARDVFLRDRQLQTTTRVSV